MRPLSLELAGLIEAKMDRAWDLWDLVLDEVGGWARPWARAGEKRGDK
jgi:hypothetical protein